MKSLAIIGTGIAGMACGYYLHKEYAVTVYEKNDYVGGHTHAVDVEEDARFIPIDTGFIIYNEVSYPHLTKLFEELGVATQPSDMSFEACSTNRRDSSFAAPASPGFLPRGKIFSIQNSGCC